MVGFSAFLLVAFCLALLVICTNSQTVKKIPSQMDNFTLSEMHGRKKYLRSGAKKPQQSEGETLKKAKKGALVKQDLRTLDKYDMQKCWGGDDPVELVFGRDIWVKPGTTESLKIGARLCLYEGEGHPKKFCKQVYCPLDYTYCVRISGLHAYFKDKRTVVGCSKDAVEQCYRDGKSKRTGPTYGFQLGGPIGDVWNTDNKVLACQCKDVTAKNATEHDKKELCNSNCVTNVQTCAAARPKMHTGILLIAIILQSCFVT